MVSPTLKIKYVPFPSKFGLLLELIKVEAPIDPFLLVALAYLLPPFPPTKLSALPLPAPKILAAADLTPLATPTPEVDACIL